MISSAKCSLLLHVKASLILSIRHSFIITPKSYFLGRPKDSVHWTEELQPANWLKTMAHIFWRENEADRSSGSWFMLSLAYILFSPFRAKHWGIGGKPMPFYFTQKPQEMNDLSSLLAVFFYGHTSQFFCFIWNFFISPEARCILRYDQTRGKPHVWLCWFDVKQSRRF